jgi:hypothetical protein
MGLGSGIRKNLFGIPDPDPGVKFYRIPNPGSGSATLEWGEDMSARRQRRKERDLRKAAKKGDEKGHAV